MDGEDPAHVPEDAGHDPGHTGDEQRTPVDLANPLENGEHTGTGDEHDGGDGHEERDRRVPGVVGMPRQRIVGGDGHHGTDDGCDPDSRRHVVTPVHHCLPPGPAPMALRARRLRATPVWLPVWTERPARATRVRSGRGPGDGAPLPSWGAAREPPGNRPGAARGNISPERDAARLRAPPEPCDAEPVAAYWGGPETSCTVALWAWPEAFVHPTVTLAPGWKGSIRLVSDDAEVTD